RRGYAAGTGTDCHRCADAEIISGAAVRRSGSPGRTVALNKARRGTVFLARTRYGRRQAFHVPHQLLAGEVLHHEPSRHSDEIGPETISSTVWQQNPHDEQPASFSPMMCNE